MRAIIFYLLIVLPASDGLNFFCFVNNSNYAKEISTRCTHLVIKEYAQISAQGVEFEHSSLYMWPIMHVASTIKLYAELTPKNRTLTFPIGIGEDKHFVREFKRKWHQLRVLNPLKGFPTFTGIFFRAAAFQKEGEYFGFFNLLAKLRGGKLSKASHSFGEIALEIDADFDPYTIGFPTNTAISSLIDIFYLQLMSDQMLTSMAEKQSQVPYSMVQLNPLFVSKSAAPMFSITYQKDMLQKLNIFSKTVVGFSTSGYEMKFGSGSLLELNSFKKLNTSMLCSLLSSNVSVMYDRQSFTTSFFRESSFVIFNMPYHQSLSEKIQWIRQYEFFGIGLESLENDLDVEDLCGYQTHFPLHDYVGRIIEALEDKQKDKESMAIMQLTKAAKEDDDQPINADIHLYGNISSLPALVWSKIETQNYYTNHSDETEHSTKNNSNNTMVEESAEIGKLIQNSVMSCSEICGVADDLFIESDFNRKASFRTIGGEVLVENVYPWIVFVRVEVKCEVGPPIYVHCTGVLVSFEFVITAAHCLYIESDAYNRCLGTDFPNLINMQARNKDVFIHYGSNSIQRTKIEKIYKANIDKQSFKMTNYETLREKDIALIQLSRKLDRKVDNVVPICLARQHSYELMGQMGIVAGFGGEYHESSNWLNKSLTATHVSMRSPAYCQHLYNNEPFRWNYKPEHFICAGGTNKGFTFGDCGGPLMQERNGIYYLIGLVMSNKAGLPFKYKKYVPDVYTRVGSKSICEFLERASDKKVTCMWMQLSPAELWGCSIAALSPTGTKRFVTKMAKVTESANEQIYGEFEALNQPFLQTIRPRTTEAELSENIRKNRFYDILPFEFNRVRLRWVNAYGGTDARSDYINASYIRSKENGPIHCIAAQGPITETEAADGRRVTTVRDFWELIWQEGIDCVVMLEGGKQNFVEYWPEAPGESVQIADDFSVHLYCVTDDEICLQREVWIERQGLPKRKVFQWHFRDWPDAGGAGHARIEALLDFVHAVQCSPKRSPFLVHCRKMLKNGKFWLPCSCFIRLLILLLRFLHIFTVLAIMPPISADVADDGIEHKQQQTAQLRIRVDQQQQQQQSLLEIGIGTAAVAAADHRGNAVPSDDGFSDVLDKDNMEQCPSLKDTSFYIEHLRPFVGRMIGKMSPIEMPSVDECAKQCLQMANCAGANFMLGLNGEPICTLHSSVTLGAEAESPLEPIFGISRFCLRRDPFDPITQLCSAPWTFQKFAKIRPIEMSSEFLVENWDGNSGGGNLSSLYSLDECLQECHRNPNCAGALYSSIERGCRLSKISPHNVHGIRQHFMHNTEWDFYELNCVRGHLNPSRCAFNRIRHAGFTTPFTALLHDVATPEQCQSACAAFLHALTAHQSRQTTTICRAWTHNANNSKCFLNHLALRSLGRNVLERMDPGLSSGEVDECMDFKLDCHLHSLTLSGFSPLKLFHGNVTPKRRTTTTTVAESEAENCTRRIAIPVHAFRVRLAFAQCAFATDGTVAGGGERRRHSNTLMVKEASTALITARDKTVQVNCYVRRRPFAVVDDDDHPADEAATASSSLLTTTTTTSSSTTNFVGPLPPLLHVRFHTAKNETGKSVRVEEDEGGQVGAVPATPLSAGDEQQQLLSTRVLLKNPPSSRPVDELQQQQRRHNAGPAYRLEVLDAFGIPVQKVELGMPGFLEIRRQQQQQRGRHRTFPASHNQQDEDGDGALLISDLKAINSDNGEEEAAQKSAVELIDANGCVTNASMVTSIRQMDQNRLRIGIRFVAFGDKVRVAYQAVVKRCQFGCRLDCNRHFYNIDTGAADQQQTQQMEELDDPPLDYHGAEEEALPDASNNEEAEDDENLSKSRRKNDHWDVPMPIHRIHRRAIPMPTMERTVRHFKLDDELWEVRTHGMETTVVDRRMENNDGQMLISEKKIFAVRLRDNLLNMVAATLLAVLLLTCVYLACIIINLWLLNIHLSVANCLHRFIALFAHVQQLQQQQPSSASPPLHEEETAKNAVPRMATKNA